MKDGVSQFQNFRAIGREKVVAKGSVTRLHVSFGGACLHQEADMGADSVPDLLEIGLDKRTCLIVKREAQELMASIDVARLAQQPVPSDKVVGRW